MERKSIVNAQIHNNIFLYAGTIFFPELWEVCLIQATRTKQLQQLEFTQTSPTKKAIMLKCHHFAFVVLICMGVHCSLFSIKRICKLLIWCTLSFVLRGELTLVMESHVWPYFTVLFWVFQTITCAPFKFWLKFCHHYPKNTCQTHSRAIRVIYSCRGWKWN